MALVKGPAPQNLLVRFFSRVGAPDAMGCWPWLLRYRGQRYGRLSLRRWLGGQTNIGAHVFAWEYFHRREVPEGLQVDHTCFHTWCVNPAHLELVTAKVNAHRFHAAAGRGRWKTHCAQGHPYTPENTGRSRRGTPLEQRYCRTCSRLNNEQYRHRRSA